jgi:hypothetical protein
MEKKQIIKIVTWATAALIIPVFGQLFVNGWNWGLGDFAFAWVFFNMLGLTYVFVTNKIVNRTTRIVAGLAVIAVFVFIWVRLATG